MLKIFVSIVVALILAPIVSFFSAEVILGHDRSQADTVGEIARHGFPIWYTESAPGFSVVDGLHERRLELNTMFWFIVLTAVVFAIYGHIQRRSGKSPPAG